MFSLRKESFFIKWKMSNLIYKLKLLTSWKIHLIVSIIYLEQIHSKSSIFNHQSSSSVTVNKHEEYQIKKILKCQINKKENQLLIKWVEYDELIWKLFDEIQKMFLSWYNVFWSRNWKNDQESDSNLTQAKHDLISFMNCIE